MPTDNLPIIHFESPEVWHKWLQENHETAPGLWLKIAKKSSGIPSVTYDEALEVALCFGWIDGQKGALDDQFWLQRFTHRRPKSKWSRINRDKATRLIKTGKMLPSGLQEVEAAKSDGRWEAAYSSQQSIEVPQDLQTELDRFPEAKAFFESLNKSSRYSILYHIHDAKRPETRVRRIQKHVDMLKAGKKIY